MDSYELLKAQRRALNRALRQARAPTTTVEGKSFKVPEGPLADRVKEILSSVEWDGYWLSSQYSLTKAEVIDLLIKQNGMCKVCGEDLRKGKRPNVDHNHETKKVRGIICTSCNTGIRDIPKLILFLKYLRACGEDIQPLIDALTK